MSIDISGLSKSQVIATLFNAAHPPRGMGVMQFRTGPLVMNEEWAQQLIDEGAAFWPLHHSGMFVDYVHGRAIKADLEGDFLDAREFEAHNGEGCAQKAIQHLRQTGEVLMAPSCDARTWLNQVADESLKPFDDGRKDEAFVYFLVSVAKHHGTSSIPEWELTVPILIDGIKGTRQEFRKAMVGFSV